MAIVTNKNGLPQPIVDAIGYDTYRIGGDISTTTLIDAPQIRVLKMQHSREIETDASEMLFALMGTAIHHILERAHIKDYRKAAFLTVIETLKDESKDYSQKDQEALQGLINTLVKLMVKFFPELETRYMWEMTLQYEYRGKVLYGTFDLYDKIDKILFDYKVCSVYAYAYPESRKKWAAQTNTYAFLLRESKHAYEVKEIYVVAIFRDWSSSKSKFDKGDYPPQQVVTLPMEIVKHETMRKYIHGRMDLHINAELGEVPDCTGAERWARSSVYSVKSPILKKAIRNFDKERDAMDFIEQNRHRYEVPLSIFLRPGESKRCESYCAVRDFCSQKKLMDKENEN